MKIFYWILNETVKGIAFLFFYSKNAANNGKEKWCLVPAALSTSPHPL